MYTSNYIEYRFLVMERMDKPIDEVVPILLNLHGNKTGVSKVPLGDVAISMVNCIEAMHNNGNLFVDVKTENFMLARSSSSNAASFKKSSSKKSSSNVGQLVRLIDFGLVERFGDMSTSKHRENLHPDAQLVGTPTYASLNVSSGHTVSRRDDLESVGYIISELILMLITSGGKKKNENVLPWSRAKSDEEVFRIKSQEMDKSKRSKSKLFTALKSCGADSIMIKYFSVVQSLSYAEKPDYDLYRTLLKKLVVSVESGGAKKKSASAASPKKKAAAKSPARRTSARRKHQADDEDSDVEMVDEENVENRKKAASGSTSSSSKKQKVSVGKESAKAPRRTKRSTTKSRTIGTQTDVEVINVDDSDDDDDMDWEKVEASASEESKGASSKGKGILKLDIIEGPHKGEDISIGGECQDTVIVGRDTESSATKKDTTKFSISKDSSVSAVHAKFVINTKSSVSSCRVTDMSSSSSDGTFINGSCLASGKSKQAFVNDKIKIGESTFQIKKA